MLREVLSNPGDFFAGWRPVRVARVAVKYQRIGLQRSFEFFLIECNCLVVVVRTHNFEFETVVHKPSSCTARSRQSSCPMPAGHQMNVVPLWSCAQRTKQCCQALMVSKPESNVLSLARWPAIPDTIWSIGS